MLGSVLASIATPAARFLAGGVGAGLVGAALTNTCAMGTLLARLPYNRTSGETDHRATARLLKSGAPAPRSGRPGACPAA